MKYSEETLQNWVKPLSPSEEIRAEHTVSMISRTIKSDEKLKEMDIEIFKQGSYANNTNVRSDSDVDICVMLKDTFHTEYAPGKDRKDYGFVASKLSFSDYRELVKNALLAAFQDEDVYDGNKSLKIKENTYHVKADVVPAFQLRNYYYTGSVDPNNYIEGTWFRTQNGKSISNYPKRHLKNGINKNNATNYDYKKLVRIMKHIKNEMADQGLVDGEVITSFLVECLIYNIPNSIITGYSSWSETVKQSILYLSQSIEEDKHKEWCEVSDMLYLFNGRKWNDSDVLFWLEIMLKYLEY